MAYVSVDSEQQTLWIRQVPTSTNIEVIPARPAAYWGLSFSPDGNYLYYWGTSKDNPPSLFQIPSLGGVSRKLISGVENTNSGNNPVSFSPDGSRLTFVREYQTGESAVVVVNSDGTGEQVLARRGGNSFFSTSAWSPPGDRIAGVFGTADAHGPYTGIVGIGVNDGSEHLITSEKWQWISDVAWTRDGNNLLITGSQQAGDPIQIWEVNCSTGTARRITTDLNSYSGLSLTTDSRGLVTTLNEKLMHIWTQDVGEGTEAKQITFGTATKDGWSGIGWTSDNRIVYTSTANGSQDIWIMDADGRNQRQLTVNFGSDRFGLAVSPDDRFAVFVSDRDGKQHIWRVNINDGSLKQLTSGEGESDPFFSPDGQWVSYHDSTVKRVPIDGGTPVQLDKQFADQLSVSPDGRFSANLLGIAGNRPRIAIAPAGGGEPIKEFDLPPTPPRRIQWAPDSSALTYIGDKGRVSNLFNQPIDGGPPSQLTDLKSFRIHSFAWSRDGKQLAMARWTVTSDIVLMKDFR